MRWRRLWHQDQGEAGPALVLVLTVALIAAIICGARAQNDPSPEPGQEAVTLAEMGINSTTWAEAIPNYDKVDTSRYGSVTVTIHVNIANTSNSTHTVEFAGPICSYSVAGVMKGYKPVKQIVVAAHAVVIKDEKQVLLLPAEVYYFEQESKGHITTIDGHPVRP
jgi:hypothetical protein